MTMIDTAMGALRATVAKALGRCGDRAERRAGERLTNRDDAVVTMTPDRPSCVRVTAMGIVSWLRRPGRSASRPESSPAGRRGPSDSFSPAPARTVAGFGGAAPRLRRAATALLLGLPLLFGFAAGAAAQTISLNAPADANEGDSGTADKNFAVTASSTLPQNVQVRLCLSGTATRNSSAGVDLGFSDPRRGLFPA